MSYRLYCSKCGKRAEEEPAYKCKACGGILVFDYAFAPGDYRTEPENPGVFRFSRMLPVQGPYDACSLMEGGTPLIPGAGLSRRLGLERLYWKLESLNPSASFKDRGIAVALNCARRFGIERAVIASSGNASASAAAYAARCGMELIAVVPESTPDNKVAQAACHGAKVVKVPGVFSDSYALARRAAEEKRWMDLTTTFVSPYAREGYKTIGYELYEQLGRVPDWIVIPTGAGPILAAIHQAFRELRAMGRVERLPRLVCVQAENCGPIASAFRSGRPVEACTDAKPTLASGINDSLTGYTGDGTFTVDCIRESGGSAVLLSETEIERSVFLLAQEGIYAEPAAAVSAAALEKLRRSGEIGTDDTVVGVVTGHGLKNPIQVKTAAPVVSTVEELAAAVEGIAP